MLQLCRRAALAALAIILVSTVVLSAWTMGQEDTSLPAASATASASSEAAQPLAKPVAALVQQETLQVVELAQTRAVGPVSLRFSSVENDLYITLVDAAGETVEGIPFTVTLTGPDGTAETHTDEEGKGSLHLDGLAAGDYQVTLEPSEEGLFEAPAEAFAAAVKDKVAYEKIDQIEAIVVDETEVDVSEEDAALVNPSEEGEVFVPEEETPAPSETPEVAGPATPSEPQLTDTVELLPSTAEEVPVYTELAVIRYRPAGVSLAGNLLLTLPRALPEQPETPAEEDPAPSDPAGETPADPSETPVPPAEGTDSSADGQDTASSSDAPNTTEASSASDPTLEIAGMSLQNQTDTDLLYDSGLAPVYDEEGYLTHALDGTGAEVAIFGEDGEPLADRDGVPLYQLWGEETTERVESGTTLRYTGWQTLEGKTYYFDREGRPVTGEQVIGGVRYIFDEDGVLLEEDPSSGSSDTAGPVLGIDVSVWQGAIDWTAVRRSGVEFVMIRCGYRGYGSGALVEDSRFRQNIQGAIAAGLKVGVYFFSQAVNEREAVEEASLCLSLVRGYNLAYPIAIDVEHVSASARANNLTAAQRTAICQAFCETIRGAGYTPMVYSNKNWLEEKVNVGQLTGYKIWLAHYTSSTNYSKSRYDIWQYTQKGEIAGIDGYVDCNYSYLGY